MKELLSDPASISVAVGTTLSVARGTAVVLAAHREKSHHAVKLGGKTEKVARFLQESIGSIPEVWAAIHRVHHAWADVNGKAFLDRMRLIKEATSRGLPAPSQHAGLDPYVPSFTTEEVIEIGSFGESEVIERLRDHYQHPQIVDTDEELLHKLNRQTPEYFYKKTKRNEPLTQDIIEDYLLTDPHSPSLIGPDRKGRLNGVRRTLISSAKRYAEMGKCFKQNPWLMPPDLQPEDPEAALPSRRKQVIAGAAIATAAAVALSGDYSPKNIISAALITGALGSLPVAGGSRIVNGPGHMGDAPEGDKNVVEAMTLPEYEILLNDDGTVGANAHKGTVSQILRVITYDELDQDNHHDFPADIAYNRNRANGINSTAPFGTQVVRALNHPHSGIMAGAGFETDDHGLRPDDANLATRMVQQIRSERNPHLIAKCPAG